MMQSNIIRRLVGCQGSIQLIAALTAMKVRGEEQSGVKYEDHLIIYDLHAPASHVNAFMKYVADMARFAHAWKSIQCISDVTLQHLIHICNTRPRSTAFEKVYEVVGLRKVDELFLPRNWQKGNQLIINAYANSRKICYGDSIGIYFSEHYFASSKKPKLPSDFLLELLRRVRVNLGLRTELKIIPFDIGYFFLPDSFDAMPPMPFVKYGKVAIRNTFQRYENFIPQNIVDAYREIFLGKNIAVVITTPLSEVGRMEIEDELSAYKEWICKLGIPRDATFVIKPHPRDSKAKIERLSKLLRSYFREVITLDRIEFFFMPFEIFLMQTMANNRWDLPESIRILSISSACLSISALFNKVSYIGFGEKIVRKYFKPEMISGRLRHEKDLVNTVQRLVNEPYAGS